MSENRALLPAVRSGAVALASCAAALVALAGCGPVRLVASTNIPQPLVVKIPVTVALFIPKEFSEHVHKEERWSTDWNVDLGRAQSDGITRLLTAMFDKVVMVDSINAAAQLGSEVRAVLEPSIEEYAFVTPRDAGSPFYAVSIKYRVNVYSPDGKLADSWGFTGYGTAAAQGLSSNLPLTQATALAMRDAGAKLAVEFREQAIVRGMLPESDSVDAPPRMMPSGEPAPSVETTPAATAPEQAPTQESAAPPAVQPAEGQAPGSEAPASQEPGLEPSAPDPTKPEQPPAAPSRESLTGHRWAGASQ